MTYIETAVPSSHIQPYMDDSGLRCALALLNSQELGREIQKDLKINLYSRYNGFEQETSTIPVLAEFQEILYHVSQVNDLIKLDNIELLARLIDPDESLAKTNHLFKLALTHKNFENNFYQINQIQDPFLIKNIKLVIKLIDPKQGLAVTENLFNLILMHEHQNLLYNALDLLSDWHPSPSIPNKKNSRTPITPHLLLPLILEDFKTPHRTVSILLYLAKQKLQAGLDPIFINFRRLNKPRLYAVFQALNSINWSDEKVLNCLLGYIHAELWPEHKIFLQPDYVKKFLQLINKLQKFTQESALYFLMALTNVNSYAQFNCLLSMIHQVNTLGIQIIWDEIKNQVIKKSTTGLGKNFVKPSIVWSNQFSYPSLNDDLIATFISLMPFEMTLPLIPRILDSKGFSAIQSAHLKNSVSFFKTPRSAIKQKYPENPEVSDENLAKKMTT